MSPSKSSSLQVWNILFRGTSAQRSPRSAADKGHNSTQCLWPGTFTEKLKFGIVWKCIPNGNRFTFDKELRRTLSDWAAPNYGKPARYPVELLHWNVRAGLLCWGWRVGKFQWLQMQLLLLNDRSRAIKRDDGTFWRDLTNFEWWHPCPFQAFWRYVHYGWESCGCHTEPMTCTLLGVGTKKHGLWQRRIVEISCQD